MLYRGGLYILRNYKILNPNVFFTQKTFGFSYLFFFSVRPSGRLILSWREARLMLMLLKLFSCPLQLALFCQL